ncbi:MAG TPA: hypothetical protein VMV18_07095, partial [bacterium]|nr:hypothetical protein [bacterium]
MFEDVKRTLTIASATTLFIGAFVAPRVAFSGAPAKAPTVVAQANKNAQDEAAFKEFEGIVADFSTPEKISAWEAFLQKYPNSSYVPKVKDIIAELKGEKKAAAVVPAATPAGTPYNDPDLDFLNGAATPTPAPVVRPTPHPLPPATPTPVAAATPRPTPRPTPSPSLLDSPDSGRKTDRFSWNDSGTSSGSGSPSSSSSDHTERSASRDDSSVHSSRSFDPPPPRVPRTRYNPNRGIGTPYHFEVSPYVGISPDETYVRNLLYGVAVTEHFGPTWAVSFEGVGATDSETALLKSLRALNAEPEVISKYNWMAGGTVDINLLSAMDPVSNTIEARNDLYLHIGGGDLNTNLEICKQTGGVKCAAPLYINGVNFTWATAGVGHRFYVTKNLLL